MLDVLIEVDDKIDDQDIELSGRIHANTNSWEALSRCIMHAFPLGLLQRGDYQAGKIDRTKDPERADCPGQRWHFDS